MVLSSGDDARAVMLQIPAGDVLHDHQVHERAWVMVIDGEVEITTAGGESVAGAAGLMVEFAPGERHAVLARTATRLLLLLTPGRATATQARWRSATRRRSGSARPSTDRERGRRDRRGVRAPWVRRQPPRARMDGRGRPGSERVDP